MRKMFFFIPLLLALVCAAGTLLRPAVLPTEPPRAAVRQEPEAALAVPPTEEPTEETVLADWRLTLVNPQNPLPPGYVPTLTRLRNGQAVDERCYPALQAMMVACRAAGLEPLICSSYRTEEKQTALFENKVARLRAQGLSEEAARAGAAKVVALPGTSEHQLGLAVDIVDMGYQLLDEGQADTPAQRWLMEHCWEYGFILRYPAEKEAVTGIIYEPWHYRYVGEDNARAIRESGLCLEEWLERKG